MVKQVDTIEEKTELQELSYKTKYAKNVDAKALERELKAAVQGEVRFDDGSRALYATDASNYRQIPIGVVLPKSEAGYYKYGSTLQKI